MSATLKAKINGQWTPITSGSESGIEVPSTLNLLKGNGSGGVASATPNIDYQTPLGNGSVSVAMLKNDVFDEIENRFGFSSLNYGDSINKPFDFNGKTIRFFGDSITAGVISGTHSNADKGYSTLFCNKVGATEINSAIDGSSTATRNGAYNSVYDIINGLSTVNADYIIIASGTNDYYYQVPIGTFDSTDQSTFYGALNQICTKLASIAPNVPIIFITPINKPTASTAITKVSSLNDYRNAIFEVAVSYGHSVVNGASLGFPTKHGENLNAYSYKVIADGVHPSVDGHKLYARSLCGKLLGTTSSYYTKTEIDNIVGNIETSLQGV